MGLISTTTCFPRERVTRQEIQSRGDNFMLACSWTRKIEAGFPRRCLYNITRPVSAGVARMGAVIDFRPVPPLFDDGAAAAAAVVLAAAASAAASVAVVVAVAAGLEGCRP